MFRHVPEDFRWICGAFAHRCLPINPRHAAVLAAFSTGLAPSRLERWPADGAAVQVLSQTLPAKRCNDR